jgi:hypothetical protein
MSATPTPEPTPLTQAEVKQQILDHLAEKYGEEFEAYGVGYRGTSQNYDFMYAYPKNGDGNPKHNFFVIRGGSGRNVSFSDDYVGYLLEPVVEAKFEEIVAPHLGEHIMMVQTWVTTYPVCMDNTTPQEVVLDYLGKHTGIRFSIWTVLTPELEASLQQTSDAIVAQLQDYVAIGSFSLTTLAPDDFAAGKAEWDANDEAEFALNYPFPPSYPQQELPEIEWGTANPNYQFPC